MSHHSTVPGLPDAVLTTPAPSPGAGWAAWTWAPGPWLRTAPGGHVRVRLPSEALEDAERQPDSLSG